MGKYNIMKAVDFDKLPAKFKKAHPFDGLRAEGYWLQKKYDGCFGMAVIDGDNSRMLSRTGEDYSASCGHILAALRHAAGMMHFSRGDVILGEVWHPTDQFPKISGDMRRGSPSPHLMFVINDVLPQGCATGIPYSTRYTWVEELMFPPQPVLWKAATWKSGEWAGCPKDQALDWKTNGGFDGAILRNPDAGYTIGDVKNGEIIKVKPVMSLDLYAVAWREGVGEKTGRPVFTLEVEYAGVRTLVGSGVPHSRDVIEGMFKDHARLPIVEIECMGITEDGKLREPRFKGIRHDKLKPD